MATVLDPLALPLDPWELPTVPVKRWTAAEYHRLLELGMLRENDPYELIDGWLVPKKTKIPSHNAAVRRLDRMFQTRLAGTD